MGGRSGVKNPVLAGNETKFGELRRVYKSLPAQSMHWDAPIAISVFRERKGRKRQALCMSIYLVKDVLYIRQIQGIAGTAAPKELRDWPKILEDACRTFVRQEGLEEVRLPKAETLYSLSQSSRQFAAHAKRARKNSKRKSNKVWSCYIMSNAEQLGFMSRWRLVTWQVPSRHAS